MAKREPLTLSMTVREYMNWATNTIQLGIDLEAMTTGRPVVVESKYIISQTLDELIGKSCGNRSSITSTDVKVMTIGVLKQALRVLDPNALAPEPTFTSGSV